MNKVELTGNIGKGGVKLTEFDSGKCIATFSLVTNETVNKDKEDEKQYTDWDTIKCWNNTAKETAEQFEQGSKQKAILNTTNLN